MAGGWWLVAGGWRLAAGGWGVCVVLTVITAILINIAHRRRTMRNGRQPYVQLRTILRTLSITVVIHGVALIHSASALFFSNERCQGGQHQLETDQLETDIFTHSSATDTDRLPKLSGSRVPGGGSRVPDITASFSVGVSARRRSLRLSKRAILGPSPTRLLRRRALAGRPDRRGSTADNRGPRARALPTNHNKPPLPHTCHEANPHPRVETLMILSDLKVS